uniref:Multisubstrate pseudouridine synthase 7 isoform X2 n=1 Tax=Rhizophora mucronata TaxID=61149 RepID=A0A2P2LGW5_RHIMU
MNQFLSHNSYSFDHIALSHPPPQSGEEHPNRSNAQHSHQYRLH